MSDLFPVAGAKFYIGGATETQANDFIATDFSAETWVEVDGWETAGSKGDTAELITTQLINRNRDAKQKGTRNAGSMQNVFASLPGDAGQAAMRAAESSTNNFAFRVVYDDIPDGGTTGTTHYFVGLVMSWQDQGGSANTTRMRQATVEINSNIVEVAAA
ncbi:hypothetical protein GCM10007385_35520 [Tateyamaria omphalii]|uniref:hypothetical protein n=1 Tax=Tateyamaria omphalii TaxID=299262 RepID=UPI001673FA6F|nr:hypothetical protein [Tateyamaria omphalii]GGX63283.1 hypothetical protein GCM10007385_35520 [Tateyamaria omphalii]